MNYFLTADASISMIILILMLQNSQKIILGQRTKFQSSEHLPNSCRLSQNSPFFRNLLVEGLDYFQALQTIFLKENEELIFLAGLDITQSTLFHHFLALLALLAIFYSNKAGQNSTFPPGRQRPSGRPLLLKLSSKRGREGFRGFLAIH